MARPNRRDSSPKKGRGYRTVQKSKKAEEILASGLTLAGLPPSSSETEQPVTMSQPQAAGVKRSRGRPSKASDPVAKLANAAGPTTVEYCGSIFHIPSFGSDTRRIYFWPYPYPKSFVDLTDNFRKFKEQTDKEEQEKDINDGADDWDMFAGPFDRGGDNKNVFSMAASVFVKQAKRAFWADKTWEQFEKEQLLAKTDEEELPNKIRLAIYHKLKTRLCEEIWSQAYPADEAAQDSKIPSPEVEEARAKSRNAPKASGAVQKGDNKTLPSTSKRPRIEAPTAEQAAKGITGIATDRFGVQQPLYEGETEAPSMDRHLAEARREREQASSQIASGDRNPGQVTEELRYASANGVSLFPNQHALVPFEMAMQQAQADMETSDEEGNGNWP